MRYKKFGNTGENLSVLCLGTWALGGKQFGAVTQEDAVAAVHAMIDCGVNIVDTAPIYASGGSEEVLGKALQGGYRDKVFLITKFGSEFVDPNDSDKGTIKDSSRKNMLKSIDASYNMVNRTKEDVLKYYASQGCGTMGYGSLGGGILTGQFREVPTFGHGDMRASFYGPMFTEPGFSQIQALLKVMDGIAEAHKATVAQVAINWSLAHDYIHTVLTGVGNAAEAEENCAAAAWELTAQEKQALDEAISKIHIYS